MRRLALPRKPLGGVDIDYCGECQAIWFDAFESPQLAPEGIIALFRALQSAGPQTRAGLPARLACPRCAVALIETHDLQRATRFAYWRCPRGHGRLTPFVQFLREKDFIRPLPDEELARLKATVRTIRCASCGAPVDLERSTVCSYCRSPIVALDPDAVARAVNRPDGQAGAQARPDLDAIVDALMAAQRQQDHARGQRVSASTPVVDLVDLGVAAIVGWLRDT